MSQVRRWPGPPSGCTPGRRPLVWVLSAAVVGAGIPATFAGCLRLPWALYLLPYVGLTGAFLYAWGRWGRVHLGERIARWWIWGPLAAVPLGFFAVRTLL
jgi:hypothetical protein